MALTWSLSISDAELLFFRSVSCGVISNVCELLRFVFGGDIDNLKPRSVLGKGIREALA